MIINCNKQQQQASSRIHTPFKIWFKSLLAERESETFPVQSRLLNQQGKLLLMLKGYNN